MMQLVAECSQKDAPVLFLDQSPIQTSFENYNNFSSDFLDIIFLVLVVITVIINSIHLCVFCNKRMIGMTNRKQMIFLSVAWMLMPFMETLLVCYGLYKKSQCGGIYSYSMRVLYLASKFFSMAITQLITWSIVYVTMISVNVILKKTYSIQMSTKCGIAVCIGCFSVVSGTQLWTVLSTSIQLVTDPIQISEILSERCRSQSNEIYLFVITTPECITKLRSAIKGLFGFILPCAILIFAIIFLIFHIKKQSVIYNRHSTRQWTQNHIPLITFLLFFTLSHIPQAILYCIHLISRADFEIFQSLFYKTLLIFVLINSNIATFFYCITSSAYRSTLLAILFKKETNRIDVSTL